jgi:hypothetical protein
MLTLSSMLYIRLMSGSKVAMFATPNPAGSCPRLISQPAVWYTQPFSPCGMPSLLASVQATAAVVSASGLYASENPVVPACMYLPMLTLTAVFWLPNRSYTAPNRGEMLVQVGMSIGPNSR